MTILSWLHIGDLQINRNSIYQQQFLNDIELRIQNNNTHLDFIFVSGDISITGHKHDFLEAQTLINRLLVITKLNKNRIFFVPGNHDYIRGLNPTDQTQPLINYNNFVKSIYGKNNFTFENLIFAQKRVFSISKIKLELIGLNTSWFNQQEDRRINISTNYDLLNEQLESLLKKHEEPRLRLVLMHNAPDDFETLDKGKLKLVLQNQSGFILHSHFHKNPETPITVDSNFGKAITISVDNDPNLEERPNSYAIVKINLEEKKGSIDKANLSSTNGILKWINRVEYFSMPFVFQDTDKNREKKSENQKNDTPSEKFLTSTIDENNSEVVIPGYANDSTTGPDQLGITEEVNAFAMLLTSRQIEPPLCLGLFGDWGSGKSFFINKLRERVNLLAKESKKTEKNDSVSVFCSRVVNIDFNAWHYSDSNLWASLTCRIFQELDKYIDDNVQKSELFKALDVAKQMKDEVIEEKEEIQQEQKSIKDDLKIIRDRSENLNSKKDLLRVIYETADDLALNTSDLNLRKISEFLLSSKGIVGNLKIVINKILFDRHFLLRIVLMVMIVLLPIAFGMLLPLLSNYFDSTILKILKWIPSLGITISYLGGLQIKISKAMRTLINAKKRADSIIIESTNSLNDKVKQFERELENLKNEENEVNSKLFNAEIRLAQASAAIERVGKIDSSKTLIEFIREQTSNETFLNNLGLISLLRQNLETLSQKLIQPSIEQDSGTPSNLPKIDRIILYIDDLDRCNEKNVVDVLQAVHLLLAFKLFTVVVGVDSRWLLHSLQIEYPALYYDHKYHDKWPVEELQSWNTTPQNYLEKIFQIPFNLRPMDKLGFDKLLGSIITPLSENIPTREIEGGLFKNTTEQVLEENNIQQTEELVLHEGNDAVLGEEEVNPLIVDEEQPIFLNPKILLLEPIESEFCHALYKFLRTPRTVKLFINIYRFIRATNRVDKIEDFIGNIEKGNLGEFSIVMILLAILLGFPQVSTYFFRESLSIIGTKTWSNTIDLIKITKNNQNNTYDNFFHTNMTKAESLEWERLYRVLRDLDKEYVLPKSMEKYNRWLPIIARFSFRGGYTE